MSFVYIVTGILMGLVFGFALEKGRVFEPGMIIGQFQFRNWILAKMFLSAIATTMLVLVVLHGLGLVSLHPKATIYPAVWAGGLLFGAGMALTGACPGTVLAQIGAGYWDAWAIVLSGLLGALTYGYLEPSIAAWNSGPGEITLADTFGVPWWILGLIGAALIVVLLIFLERWRPWRDDLGENYDGLPSGSAKRSGTSPDSSQPAA